MLRFIAIILLLTTPAMAQSHVYTYHDLPVFGVDSSHNPEFDRMTQICVEHRFATKSEINPTGSIYTPPEYNAPCHELEQRYEAWVQENEARLAAEASNKEASDLADLKDFTK